ncbi:TIR domain-containing protein, partial [candidate division KSB3 bacterium]|nr:TIR domain-containing protein [candidate division KSB3 bacterium]MBD3324738.1 TIR domain-containing protein [candidate division KSB3 bacterium]
MNPVHWPFVVSLSTHERSPFDTLRTNGQHPMPTEIKVFISYAKEDHQHAQQLYHDLKQAGVVPWIDCEDLLPGQRWKVAINQALRESTYVIALLSSRSLSKRGYVQKELKKALDMLDEFSPEDIFLIPVRLDDCEPVDEKLQRLHRADLFPDYQIGLEKILRVLVPETQDSLISLRSEPLTVAEEEAEN